MTLIGVPLALILLVTYLTFISLAIILSSFFIGDLILKKIFKKTVNAFASLILGLAVFILFASLPYLGGSLVFLSIIWGLGGLLLTIKQTQAWLILKFLRPTTLGGVYNTDFDDEAAYKDCFILRGAAPTRSWLRLITSFKVSCRKWYAIIISRPKRKVNFSGFIAAGVDVIDFGLVSTPAFYFAVASYGLDGGIMISASHNPSEWNGFKIVRSKAVPVSGETGLNWMRE